MHWWHNICNVIFWQKLKWTRLWTQLVAISAFPMLEQEPSCPGPHYCGGLHVLQPTPSWNINSLWGPARKTSHISLQRQLLTISLVWVKSNAKFRKIKHAEQTGRLKIRSKELWCLVIKWQGGLMKGNLLCYSCVAKLDLPFKLNHSSWSTRRCNW